MLYLKTKPAYLCTQVLDCIPGWQIMLYPPETRDKSTSDKVTKHGTLTTCSSSNSYIDMTLGLDLDLWRYDMSSVEDTGLNDV